MVSTALLVITDGRPTLDRTLTSAAEMVLLDRFPWSVMVDDSQNPEWASRLDDLYGERFLVHHAPTKLGFSGAIQKGWQLIPSGVQFVFHLEDDWEFLRPVPVDVMTGVLFRHQHLAQMALVRDAVSRPERRAGGLLEAHPPGTFVSVTDGVSRWMEHDRWFTTNPSVYPRHVWESGWPNPPDSERKMTDRLRLSGFTFGYWGEIEDGPWVRHIGKRSTGWTP